MKVDFLNLIAFQLINNAKNRCLKGQQRHKFFKNTNIHFFQPLINIMCFKHFVLNVAKLLLLRNLKAMFKVYFERSIELCIMYYTHRVISDKEHRLLVTLSYYPIIKCSLDQVPLLLSSFSLFPSYCCLFCIFLLFFYHAGRGSRLVFRLCGPHSIWIQTQIA